MENIFKKGAKFSSKKIELSKEQLEIIDNHKKYLEKVRQTLNVDPKDLEQRMTNFNF